MNNLPVSISATTLVDSLIMNNHALSLSSTMQSTTANAANSSVTSFSSGTGLILIRLHNILGRYYFTKYLNLVYFISTQKI